MKLELQTSGETGICKIEIGVLAGCHLAVNAGALFTAVVHGMLGHPVLNAAPWRGRRRVRC